MPLSCCEGMIPLMMQVHSVKRLCCRQYAASRCNPKEGSGLLDTLWSTTEARCDQTRFAKGWSHLRQHMECVGMVNRNHSW
jgi:hypothetical protein